MLRVRTARLKVALKACAGCASKVSPIVEERCVWLRKDGRSLIVRTMNLGEQRYAEARLSCDPAANCAKTSEAFIAFAPLAKWLALEETSNGNGKEDESELGIDMDGCDSVKIICYDNRESREITLAKENGCDAFGAEHLGEPGFAFTFTHPDQMRRVLSAVRMALTKEERLSICGVQLDWMKGEESYLRSRATDGRRAVEIALYGDVSGVSAENADLGHGFLPRSAAKAWLDVFSQVLKKSDNPTALLSYLGFGDKWIDARLPLKEHVTLRMVASKFKSRFPDFDKMMREQTAQANDAASVCVTVAAPEELARVVRQAGTFAQTGEPVLLEVLGDGETVSVTAQTAGRASRSLFGKLVAGRAVFSNVAARRKVNADFFAEALEMFADVIPGKDAFVRMNAADDSGSIRISNLSGSEWAFSAIVLPRKF